MNTSGKIMINLLTMPSEKMIRLNEHYYVPESELKAHEERLKRERSAASNPDTMTPAEEEEWDISEKLRMRTNDILKS